jgi:hypothetical protein
MNNKTKIVFQGRLWEDNYIKNEFFPNNEYFYAVNDLLNLDFYANNNIEPENWVLVFSSNITEYNSLEKLCCSMKPSIIIHLSDETGKNEQYLNLAKFTPLLLRQYHHVNYNYSNYNNIIHIPLGYNNMIDTSSLDLINTDVNKRNFIWSFGGNYDKWDGKQIIDMLISKKFGNYLINNEIPIHELYNLYNDSIFVPSRKGNCNLDCLRLYEATISGAIPVLVGDKTLIENTFKYELENNEGWIIENSWDAAVNQINILLHDEHKLNIKQEKLKQWWRQRITNIKIVIDKIITY